MRYCIIWLKARGYEVIYLTVDETGRVRPEELAATISERTAMVSIMMAKNETVTMLPIQELSAIARDDSQAVQGALW